jgi:hypothetical protein
VTYLLTHSIIHHPLSTHNNSQTRFKTANAQEPWKLHQNQASKKIEALRTTIGVITDSQNTEFLPENLKHADRFGNPDGHKII